MSSLHCYFDYLESEHVAQFAYELVKAAGKKPEEVTVLDVAAGKLHNLAISIYFLSYITSKWVHQTVIMVAKSLILKYKWNWENVKMMKKIYLIYSSKAQLSNELRDVYNHRSPPGVGLKKWFSKGIG